MLRAEDRREFWVATERIMQMKEIYPESNMTPEIQIPERLIEQLPSRENALVEIIRGRLEALGPVRAISLADTMGIPISNIEQALIAIENEGFVFRGHFTPGVDGFEWCERSLLARIHRYTLNKIRKEIEPVSAADFMRFLFSWHNIHSDEKPEGPEALREVLNGSFMGRGVTTLSYEGLRPPLVRHAMPLW